MPLKPLNKKKTRCVLKYIKCSPVNLVFYINFICIYSHDLIYLIKIGKKIKTKAAAFIFLVNAHKERK
jgi:hypothetical protein